MGAVAAFLWSIAISARKRLAVKVLTTNIAGAYLKQPIGVPSSMPPRPILETFKYGAVEHFGRLQVSETNVERDRAIRPK